MTRADEEREALAGRAVERNIMWGALEERLREEVERVHVRYVGAQLTPANRSMLRMLLMDTVRQVVNTWPDVSLVDVQSRWTDLDTGLEIRALVRPGGPFEEDVEFGLRVAFW